jgi:hypothetical protein
LVRTGALVAAGAFVGELVSAPDRKAIRTKTQTVGRNLEVAKIIRKDWILTFSGKIPTGGLISGMVTD